MKKKLTFYLIIDLILAFFFVLMFNKFAINLKFHEIGGLIMLIGSILHFVIHPKYIINMSKKFFSKDFSKKARFNFIIDFLLLICAIILLINSVVISKIIFNNDGSIFAKELHKFIAAIMLLLVSIHLGLHFKMISNKLKINKFISYILIIISLSYGLFSLYKSNYISYITSPFLEEFNYTRVKGEGRGGGKNRKDGEDFSSFESIQFDYTIKTIISYGSIVYTFCFSTYLIESIIKKKKKNNRLG